MSNCSIFNRLLFNRHQRMVQFALVTVLQLLVCTQAVIADNHRYVTDRLLLNLRSGPSTSHRIIKSLPSGTIVRLVEGTEKTNGHVLVELGANTQGWLLDQYLQPTPIARQKLAKTEQSNESLKKQLGDLNSRLERVTESLDKAKQAENSMSLELNTKIQELEKIKSLSANSIEIDQRNTQLTKTNQTLQLELDKLKAENDRLNGSEQRTQWVTGASLVLLGLFASWIITNFSGRRKSNWA